jgi:hypothetical protein
LKAIRHFIIKKSSPLIHSRPESRVSGWRIKIMAAKSTIRVIKREERGLYAGPEKKAGESGGPLEMTARQVKSVVSGWVRDRQQPRLDPRRAFAELFRTA